MNSRLESSSPPVAAADDAGFGLIELLVVIGILGLVMAAVQSLHTTTQRSATTEAEVVDLQQNLRVGVSQIQRDIEMAGFLTAGLNPIAQTVNGPVGNPPDSLTLNTASEALVAATINTTNASVNVVAGDVLNLPVLAFSDSVGGFEAGDVNTTQARVVNYQTEPLGATSTFTVSEVSPTGNCGGGAVLAPCIGLRANTPGAGSINRGDLIVKTSTAAGAEGFPHTVQYSMAACPAPLLGNCLMRTAGPVGGTTAMVVATNITDLQFRYLLNGSLEVDAPTTAELPLVRAVRVTINGEIISTVPVSGGSTKDRSLSSVVAMRN